MAAVNTLSLPMKPAVSGMPAKDSRNRLIEAASTGDRLASPAQSETCEASPSPLRTTVRMANAPMVAIP